MRPRGLLGIQAAGRTESAIVMLRVIEPGDHNQQWLGVADLMKAEAQEAAKKALDKYAARIKQIAKITPEHVIREGGTAEEIIKLIDEDADIGILVLAAGSGEEGPGPLIAGLAKTAATFPIPVAIVPGQSERRRHRYDGLIFLLPPPERGRSVRVSGPGGSP